MKEIGDEATKTINTSDNLIALKKPSYNLFSDNLIKSLIENQQKKCIQLKVKNSPTQVFGRKINLHKTRDKLRPVMKIYTRKREIHCRRKGKGNIGIRIDIRCILAE